MRNGRRNFLKSNSARTIKPESIINQLKKKMKEEELLIFTGQNMYEKTNSEAVRSSIKGY